MTLFYDLEPKQAHYTLRKIITFVLLVLLILTIICLLFESVGSTLAYGKYSVTDQTLYKPIIPPGGSIPNRPSEIPIVFKNVVNKNKNPLLTQGYIYGFFLNSNEETTYWKIYIELFIKGNKSVLAVNEDVGTETFNLCTNTETTTTVLKSLTLDTKKRKGIIEMIIEVEPYIRYPIFVSCLPSGKSLVSGTIEIIQI